MEFKIALLMFRDYEIRAEPGKILEILSQIDMINDLPRCYMLGMYSRAFRFRALDNATVTSAIRPPFDEEPTYFSAHRASDRPMIPRHRGFHYRREEAG